MIRSLAFLAFMLLASIGNAQSNAVRYVDWPAENATVFGQGAWIEHHGQLDPTAGQFELVLDGLTRSVDEHSIQVELPGACRLVGTKFEVGVRPEVRAEVEDAAEAARAEIESLQTTISMRQALQAVYTEEMTMLQSNRQLSHQESLLVEDLLEAADFWRTRMKELNYKQLELAEEVAELQRKIQQQHAIIDRGNVRLTEVTGQIWLRIHSDRPQEGEVVVRYLSSAAWWKPEYDVSVSETGAIEFSRFASVSQSTGSDWNGIELEFVVGNPLSSLAPPAFERWVLKERKSVEGIASSWAYGFSESNSEDDFEPALFQGVNRMDDAASSSLTSDRYRFRPAMAPFVSKNGKTERVFIETFELQGELSYLLMPYASEEAYQLAHSNAWASSRLMPGRVQVEAGGAFRGWFDMLLPAPGDTLVVPIGQDPQVRCGRERLADNCSSSVLGGKRKSEQTWEIEVENLHNRAVEVRVEERIPVAYRPDVSVELLETTGAQLDDADGKLTWNITLEPGQRRTFVVRYRIEYPKALGFSNF